MPTYSSFIFSDKEKNDIKKLHESYRMSYGRLIKEQDKLNMPPPQLDSGTRRKPLPLKAFKADYSKSHHQFPNEMYATQAKVQIHNGTINIFKNGKWYSGNITV